MKVLKKPKWNSKKYTSSYNDYVCCVKDLLKNETVCSMKHFKHHCNVSCLDHSINVSYTSYLICKFLKLDYNSAARGALLHDMFLYDWRITNLPNGKHAFVHPCIALKNANEISSLNFVEKDIIKKHMWPLTLALPKYKESFIVCLIDKYCASIEIIHFYKNRIFHKTKSC